MTGNKAATDKQFIYLGQEATDKYNEIRFLEPIITEEVSQMIAQLGTKLIELENTVKKASSVEEKIIRKKERDKKMNSSKTSKEYLEELKDVIRYTQICKHDDIAQVTESTIKLFEAMNYSLSGVKNYYQPGYQSFGYKGINLNFITPYGQEIELQIHSEESIKAKEKSHKLYKKLGMISLFVKEKTRLQEEIYDIYSTIPNPKNIEQIRQYEMPLEGKKEFISIRKSDTEINVEHSMQGETPFIYVYTISKDNEKKFTGFEITFSDGSIWSYQNNLSTNLSHLFIIDKEGDVISKREMSYFKDKDITIEEVRKIAEKQLEAHNRWMDTYFKVKDQDDLDIIPSQSITKEEEPLL